MIRAILWKETREHLPTFAVLGFGTAALVFIVSLLFGLDPSFSKTQQAYVIWWVINLTTVFTATLSGSLLTGSDNQEKTRPWLDSLHGSALIRWVTQVTFALALQTGMAILWYGIWVILYSNHLENPKSLIVPVFVLFFSIISCISWGQWGGFRSKTVFGGFGLGFLGMFISGCAIGLSFLLIAICVRFYNYVFLTRINPDLNGFTYLVLFGIFGGIIPLALVVGQLARSDPKSAITTNPAFQFLKRWGLLIGRPFTLLSNAVIQIPAILVIGRWIWMFVKTNTTLAFILLGIGTLTGFALPHLFFAWPIWGMVCGVVGGLLVLAPDQDGEKQFMASMRSFSPFQFDLRVMMSLVFSFCLLFAPLLIPLLKGLTEWIVTGNKFMIEMRLIPLIWPGVNIFFPLGVWLLLWWACGFGAGLWTGLFFEKWIVSLGVSLGLATLVSTLWLPSFFGGELSLLWILGLVLLFWILSRFQYRRFCSGTTREKELLSFGILILTVLGFSSIAFLGRFWFLDGTKPPFDIAKTASILTNPNPRLADEVRKYSCYDMDNSLLPSMFFKPENPVSEKPVSEWTKTEKKFFEVEYQKLPQKMTEKWKTPDELVSIFVALSGDFHEKNKYLTDQPYTTCAVLKLRLLHGLWLTEKGKQDEFPEELDRVLYLAACLKYKGPFRYESLGKGSENEVCEVLENFLLNGKPDEKTLKKISDVLELHEKRLEKVERMSLEIGHFLAMRSLDNPMNYTSRIQNLDFQHPDDPKTQQFSSSIYWQIYNLAMKAPWERERKRRLINQWFQPGAPWFAFGGLPPTRLEWRQVVNEFPEVPFMVLNPEWAYPNWEIQQGIDRHNTLWNLTKIAVAAKRYQLSHKEFPRKLEDLVPRYLPSLPTDSFTGAPFQTRLVQQPKPGDKKPTPPATPPSPAEGEDEDQLTPTEKNPPGMGTGMGGPAGIVPDLESNPLLIARANKIKTVKPGTLVLWSVGLDGKSQGGFRDGQGYQVKEFTPYQSDDLLFLVGP